MVQVEAKGHPNSVRCLLQVFSRDIFTHQPSNLLRVMNAFKSIVTSDDILEKEDMYVLDKIDAFVSSEHASAFPAAKQIKKLIEQRIVCYFYFMCLWV